MSDSFTLLPVPLYDDVGLYVVVLLVMSAMSIVCPILFKPNMFSNEIVFINVAYVHKSQFCSICNFSLAI